MTSITPYKFNYNKNERQFVKSAGNVFSYSPISGSSYGAGDYITIKISSQNAFMDPQKSWLSYDLTVTDSGTGVSSLGGTSVLKDVQTVISGKVVESIYNYNVLNAIHNQHVPTDRKSTLTVLEGFNSALTASTGFTTTKPRTIHHSLQNCLGKVTDTLIPLPYLIGGVELNIITASINELAMNASLTAYTISNVRFNAYLVSPDPAISQSFQASLDAGNTAYIALPIVKSYTTKPVASTESAHILNVGINDSIRSVLQVERLAGSVNVVGTDDFALFTNNAKTSFNVSINNSKYPANSNIGCGNVGATKVDPGNLMYALISQDNDFSGFSFLGDTLGTNTEQFLTYTFAGSPELGSGVASLDGQVIVNTTYSSAPVGTEVVNSFVLIDALLGIHPDLSVSHSTVNL